MRSDLLKIILTYCDYYIVSSDFKGVSPRRIITNTPIRFRLSYIAHRIHLSDPVVNSLGIKDGWVHWPKEYDLENVAFRHAQKFNIDIFRGYTYFHQYEGIDTINSFILREGLVVDESIQSELELALYGIHLELRQKAIQSLRLTQRQLSILERIGKGEQDKQIAYELSISVSAVQKHKRTIKSKLNVGSIEEAIVEVAKAGFFNDA